LSLCGVRSLSCRTDSEFAVTRDIHLLIDYARSIVKAFARAVIVVLGTAVLIAGHAASAAAQQPLRAEVAAFIEDMVRKHGFERAALQRVFSQVQWRPEIVRAMSAPATARPWHEFRSRYIDATRIAGGVKFWEENAAALLRAGREYGVPEEIIVATIGIETFYGRNTGTVKVIDALATLAFEFPARAELFRGELEEYLLLAREAGFDSLSVRGSYAGAMGIPQFLPSSYRKYALDFDGDGRRNLWGDPTDAIGSVANYYRTFGWLTGELSPCRSKRARAGSMSRSPPASSRSSKSANSGGAASSRSRR